MKSDLQGRWFSIPRRLLAIFSSREFLAWMIGAWILVYASSMIWTKESFAYFMTALRDNLLVQIPFVLFLGSGYLNLIKTSASFFKKDKKRFLAVTCLPVGILLFLTGFFISASTRHFEWILAMPGDVVQPPWSSEAYRVETIDPGVAEQFLDIDIESGKGLFRYEPKVRVRDRGGRYYEVGAFPPEKLHDTYFHILNFGLAPNISIFEDAAEQGREFVPLRILGPGSVDTFQIQPLPYKFMLSLEPERTIQKGPIKASEYSIKSPLYRVRVLDGEKVIAEAVTKERMRFRNYELGFHEPGFWVQLEVVKDRGVLFILAGIFLTVTGVPLFVIAALVALFKKNVVLHGSV